MNKFILAAIFSLTATSFNVHALGNIADITVFDRVQDKTLPVYKHNGRYYVAGKPGNTYQIHVENRQADSIEAVVSVDAINVITGKTAKTAQNGYIFDSYGAYDIAGWRKNNNEVAGFYFTEIADSYAARTGRPGNVGVIGVALYNKKYGAPQTISQDEEMDEASDSARATPQSSPTSVSPPSTISKTESGASTRQATQKQDKSTESKKLGTGHGALEYSRVEQVAFERASSRPAEVITIYYDSYKNLVAQGIIKKPIYKKPLAKPFLDDGDTGFVPDPS